MAKSPAPNLPLRMRTGQAAQYCGLSRRFLSQLTASGNVACFRLGPRAVVYDRADLDAFMATFRIDPATGETEVGQ